MALRILLQLGHPQLLQHATPAASLFEVQAATAMFPCGAKGFSMNHLDPNRQYNETVNTPAGKVGPTMASIPLDELKAIEDKAAALDLLEAWLDVLPSREVLGIAKVDGCVHFRVGTGSDTYTSTTQETIASAIRTVLGIAYANGDR